VRSHLLCVARLLTDLSVSDSVAGASVGGAGGGSNTWQSSVTGSSGFSDGTTGAVFLPNGGIVSTGQ